MEGAKHSVPCGHQKCLTYGATTPSGLGTSVTASHRALIKPSVGIKEDLSPQNDQRLSLSAKTVVISVRLPGYSYFRVATLLEGASMEPALLLRK